MKRHTFYLYLLFLFSIVTPLLPLTAAPTLLPEKMGKPNSLNQDALMQELAVCVQHFAFISHNLITITAKHKSDNAAFSKTDQKIITTIENKYESIVHTMRSEIFSPDPTVQKRAIVTFGNYILSLCNEFNVRTKYFLKLPSCLDETVSLTTQVNLIKQAVTLLENRFITIRPTSPLRTRLANTFLYNFISTKVMPRLVSFGVGPVATGIWSLYNFAQFSVQTSDHPHKNPFYIYEKIEHQKEVTFITEPSILDKFLSFGAPLKPEEITVVPCHQPHVDNLCNGDKYIDTVPKLCEEFNIKDTKLTEYIENFVKNLSATKQEELKSKKSSEILKSMLLKPDVRREIRDYFKLNRDKLESFTEKLKWADSCKQADGCYHYRGPQSRLITAHRSLWALRPLLLLFSCYLLGQWLEEVQLPEYIYAIKQKEQLKEKNNIATEMRHLKVNYEKNIGFDQIKGQRALIENEIKMIVDYLKNPLRYKNSASGTRSLLLYGPPGTGKTLLARAIAKESDAPLFELTADDILRTNAEEKIKAIIGLAEKTAAQRPEKSAIIYIDEIDSITGNRQDGVLDPQRAKALTNLLTIFDGVEKRNPFLHILIIMATNHYKKIDPALLRPGRIDRKIAIMPPNAQGRREFFEELLPEEHKHLIDSFITQTDGYSGAQIVHIVDMAQMMAAYAGRLSSNEDDYKRALQIYKTEYETALTLAQE